MSEIVNEAVIKVTADASGVETGLRKVTEHTANVETGLLRVDDAARKTGRTLENLGTTPGLRPVGEGAGTAAGQVDRATKNMADAIQRATASMSAGTKGTAEYYAALANSRGINVAALKPYLEQLDEVTRKSALAAEAQKRLDDSTRFLADLRTRSDSIGKTASQLAEMRAAQLGVSDSARPMIEQLRAAEEATESVGSKFGKTKVALLALGTAAVAGAAMFVSMFKGAVDAADELGDLSKSTGVAVDDLAGLKLAAEQSGGELAGIADSINKLSTNIAKDGDKFRELGITAKEPLEAFKQLADLFAAIDDPQTRAALGAATLGKSWAAAAPLLAEGGTKIGEMIEKGKHLSGMTAEMVEQSDRFNDSMAELNTAFSGFKTKVASDMLPGLNNMVGAIQQAYTESGKLAAAWVALGAAGAFFFTDEFSSIPVKIKNLKEELADLEADLALSENTPGFGAIGRLLFGDTPESLREEIRKTKAEIKALQDQKNPPTPFVDEFGDRFMEAAAAYGVNRALGDKTEEEKQAREREAAIKAEASSYSSLITAIRERIVASKQEADGLKPLSESQRLQISLDEQTRAGKLALTPAHKAEYEALIKKLSANEAIIASNKRLQESDALELKGKAAAEGELRSIAEQVKAQQLVNEQIGLTGVALATLQAARLEDAAAQKEETAAALEFLQPGNDVAQTYREQAKALRDLAAAKRDGATKQASVDSAKQAAEDWKRAAQSIEQSLTDALLRGFESGKGFGRTLVDTVKNMFSTLVLRPIVSAVVNPLAGAVQGALGLSGTTTAAAGAGGGMSAGAGLGLGAAVGGIATGALQTAGAFLTGQIGLGSTLSAGLGAIGTGTASGIMAGLSSVVGVLGPIALGIGAAVAIWKKLDTSGTYHTGGASSASSAGVNTIRAESIGFQNTRVSTETNSMTAQLAAGVVGILDSTALAFGKTAGYTAATAFADDTSKDGAWGALVIQKMGQDIIDWNDTRTSRWAPKEFADGDKGRDQYLAALTKSVRTALDSIGLPEWAKSMLNGVASNASLEDLAKVVDQINKTQAALGAMRAQLVGFSSLSDTAVSALMAASGGIEKLFGNASSYYDAFYTEAEKNSTVNAKIAKQLAAVNLQMPSTREGFRALVEAQMKLGVQGAESVSVLLGVAGAFAQVHPEVEAVTKDLAAQRSALTDAYNAESGALQATITRMGSFATSLRNLGKSALLGNLSPLSPTQRYAEARAQYETVAAAARGGDENAQDRYQDVYTAFLEASRVVNASSSGYQADFSYAQAMTEEAARWAEGRVDIDQLQLDMLKSQVSGIIEVNKSVLSVREALLQYNEAMSRNTAPLTAVAPPVNTPIPYSSYGAPNTEALVAEVKALRTELAGLRQDQQQQTGDLVQAQFGAAEESAERISTGFKAATYTEKRVAPE